MVGSAHKPDQDFGAQIESDNESSLIYNPASYVERFDLSQLFEKVQPLEVELGSGDGTFLASYAETRPQSNFIGVERLLGRLRKLDRKGLRMRLANLRLVRIEASYFVEYLLPRESAAAVHIYFPDPWPKRKHRKHRLVKPEFAESLSRALMPEGRVYLRTDDADYFQQITRVFKENPMFKEVSTPADLLDRKTDFEQEFHAKGTPTLAAAFRRGADERTNESARRAT